MAKNNISLSAWTVILSHLLLSRIKRWKPIVTMSHVPFYKACNSYCRNHFWVCRLLGALPDAVLLWLIQRLVVYGAPQHFVLRKQAIALQAWASIDHGVKQIVVIGAGFDLLAFTTSWAFSDVSCFEIDLPCMQHHKTRLLRQCYGHFPVNFHALGADLAQTPLQAVLAASPAFRPDRPTLFIAEGLVMYLSDADVRAMFAGLQQLSPVSPAIVFTAIAKPPQPANTGWSKFRNRILGCNNEAFSWCMPSDLMPTFLMENGFRQVYQIGYGDLQRSYRTEPEAALIDRQNGEYVVCAVGQESER